MKFHCFQLFVAVFLLIKLLYFVSIPTINYIYCKIEEKIKAYTFTLSIFSKSSLNSNILIFENLNIVQIGIKKINIH